MASQPDTAFSLDLTACDREPIHLPGSVQPHGLLLIANPRTLEIVAGAGALETAFGEGWLGARLGDVLTQDVAALVDRTPAGPGGTVIGEPVAIDGVAYDVAFHRSGEHLLVELEPAPADGVSAAASLAWIDATSALFERAGDLASLCARAAAAFRALTGFDRVMVYRFLDDDAGRGIAEDCDPALSTFMHHHFPATDIPQQARALYVRNHTRVIPDVSYAPAPIRPAGFERVDLSDVAVRSVSPVHVQYLRNMGVGASASVPTDRAVNVGLVLTELIINATKYAYRGDPGPIVIALEQHRSRLRLIVADDGQGVDASEPAGSGFGSRMMQAVVARLGATLELTENMPGTLAILTAPIEEVAR